MLSPVLATNFFLFLFSRLINSHFFYKKHAKDWQRPLKNTEVACYYSHQNAWGKIIQSNEPALILEDDVLLSKYTPKLLADLADKKKCELISLKL
jgi:glycosyl transferase family 25